MESGLARLSRTDAVKQIRECLRQGRVRETRPFREKLAAKGLSIGDAHHVLSHGVVFEEPHHDVHFQQWRYRVEGTEPDGQYLSIIFAFEGAEDGVLLSLYSDES